jgi:3-hydroxyacyl-[acyl-carrier-protein] dehydratase
MPETTTNEFSWPVPVDHPAFAGHFPERPIVPGVVLLDRAILFADQLLARDGRTGHSSGRWQIGNAKFLSPVLPGETLVFSLQHRLRGAIAFTVRSDAREVASGTLTPSP